MTTAAPTAPAPAPMPAPPEAVDPLDAALVPAAPAVLAAPAPPAPARPRPTLFDLERRYLEIVMVLDDVGSGYDLDEGSITALANELVALDEHVDRKVEGWTKWIRSVEADAETAKAEAKRLAARGSSFEKLGDRLRETLRDAMIVMGKEKVKTALFTVNVQKCPPSVATVSIPDLATRFLKPPPPPEPDRKAILDEWKRTKTAPAGVVIRDDAKTLVIR